MTGARFEAVLARLYVDAAFRQRFLADPPGEAARAGLSHEEAQALAAVNAADLEIAATSFAHKRTQRPSQGWFRRFYLPPAAERANEADGPLSAAC